MDLAEAGALSRLVTTWKSAGGIEIDVVLEVKLVTTLKSAGGIENDVVLDVARVLRLESGVVEVVLLLMLETEVLAALLACDVEVLEVVPEFA